MQVKMSNYLIEIKPKVVELIKLLSETFDYVSVLSTDVCGTSYRVGQRQTSVSDYGFGERGFVARVYYNQTYLEYSFNEIDNVEELANTITKQLKAELIALEELQISKMESPLIYEEEITKEMLGEIEVDPESISASEILDHLKQISDAGAKHEGIIEFMASMSFAHVNKMFLSNKKDLIY